MRSGEVTDRQIARAATRKAKTLAATRIQSLSSAEAVNSLTPRIENHGRKSDGAADRQGENPSQLVDRQPPNRPVISVVQTAHLCDEKPARSEEHDCGSVLGRRAGCPERPCCNDHRSHIGESEHPPPQRVVPEAAWREKGRRARGARQVRFVDDAGRHSDSPHPLGLVRFVLPDCTIGQVGDACEPRRSGSQEERRPGVEATRRSKIGPRRDDRTASGFDPRREESNPPVVGIRAARLVGPPLRLDEIPARLGEQCELRERRGRPRLEGVRAKRGVTRSQWSTVRGGPSALLKSVPGEERNELEQEDEEYERRERGAHAPAAALGSFTNWRTEGEGQRRDADQRDRGKLPEPVHSGADSEREGDRGGARE